MAVTDEDAQISHHSPRKDYRLTHKNTPERRHRDGRPPGDVYKGGILLGAG
jgi:hypothetical protein